MEDISTMTRHVLHTAFLSLSLVALVPFAGATQEACPGKPNAHVIERTSETLPDGTIKHRTRCACDATYENKKGECVAIVIDPGVYISREDYEAALRYRVQLLDLVNKLQVKLTEVRNWRHDLSKYSQEWESVRQEALAGVLSDILATIPAEHFALQISTLGIAANLPADFQTKVVQAFEAVKGLVSTTEGIAISKQPDAERMKRIAEGNLSLVKAMQLLPDTPANAKSRRALAGTYALFEIAVKGLAYTQREPTKNWAMEISALAELAGEIWGSVNPYVGAAVGGAKLTVRAGQYYFARNALNDLSGVLNANWNAEFFLQAKIDRTNEFLGEQDRLIILYQSANPKAPR